MHLWTSNALTCIHFGRYHHHRSGVPDTGGGRRPDALHVLGGEEGPRLQLPRALPGRGVPHPHALLARPGRATKSRLTISAPRVSLNLKIVCSKPAIAVSLNLKLVLLPADAAADGECRDDGVRVRRRAGVLRLHHLRHRQPHQAPRLRRVRHGGHLFVP